MHGADRSPEMRDLVALDMMIQSFFWKQPNIETVILRPVHIVGSELNNAPSRYFRLDKIPTLLGYDPMVQLVHASDVARAIQLSLKPNVRGIFNIVGDSQAPLSRLIKKLKTPSFGIPEFVLRRLMRSAFRYRLVSFPPGELDHLKYTCLIDGSLAAKELKYEPKVNLSAILKNLKPLKPKPSK